jgi:hypothetical protein
MASAGRSPDDPLRAALAALPLARAATTARMWLRPEPDVAADALPETTVATGAVEATAAAVIGRYLENKRQIAASARARGVRVLFVWQPAPDEGGGAAARRVGYARLAARDDLGPDFVWCAEVPGGTDTLDGVHYTPRTARELARCIARAFGDRAGDADG